MTVAWDLHYDRRVSSGFLSHFLPAGVARSLVEYARHAPFPVDLQMRHDPKANTEHASLYVGLTAVLNVRHKAGGMLALDTHKAHVTGFGFDPAWKTPKVVEAWSLKWRLVEDYLERIIPAATAAHASKEGAVQAAASVFASDVRTMVDREAAVHFKTAAVKKRIMTEVVEPVVAAVRAVGRRVPGQRPTSFGGECDLLAVDEAGRLLAVEVKPRNSTSIRWAAAQATVYSRLLERWIGQELDGLDYPGEILRA